MSSKCRPRGFELEVTSYCVVQQALTVSNISDQGLGHELCVCAISISPSLLFSRLTGVDTAPSFGEVARRITRQGPPATQTHLFRACQAWDTESFIDFCPYLCLCLFLRLLLCLSRESDPLSHSHRKLRELRISRISSPYPKISGTNITVAPIKESGTQSSTRHAN